MIDAAFIVVVMVPIGLAITRPSTIAAAQKEAAQRRDANIARLERELEIGD